MPHASPKAVSETTQGNVTTTTYANGSVSKRIEQANGSVVHRYTDADGRQQSMNIAWPDGRVTSHYGRLFMGMRGHRVRRSSYLPNSLVEIRPPRLSFLRAMRVERMPENSSSVDASPEEKGSESPSAFVP